MTRKLVLINPGPPDLQAKFEARAAELFGADRIVHGLQLELPRNATPEGWLGSGQINASIAGAMDKAVNRSPVDLNTLDELFVMIDFEPEINETLHGYGTRGPSRAFIECVSRMLRAARNYADMSLGLLAQNTRIGMYGIPHVDATPIAQELDHAASNGAALHHADYIAPRFYIGKEGPARETSVFNYTPQITRVAESIGVCQLIAQGRPVVPMVWTSKEAEGVRDYLTLVTAIAGAQPETYAQPSIDRLILWANNTTDEKADTFTQLLDEAAPPLARWLEGSS